MAFWAVYSKWWFRYWRKNIPNMISLYKQQLYKEWFKSLPKEEKLKEMQKKEQERKEQKMRSEQFAIAYRLMLSTMEYLAIRNN